MASEPEKSSQEAAESTGKEKTAPEPPRDDLVEVAVKFLNNPRVIGSPLEQKKAFLQTKGLTDSEIEEAIKLSQLTPSPTLTPPPPPPPPHTPSQLSPFTTHTGSPPHRTWRDYAVVIAVVGGIGYALYKFFKSYAIPWLNWRLEQNERVEEMGLAVRQLQTNLDTTVSEISETTASIRDVVTEQRELIQTIAAKLTALQSSVPGSGLAVKEIRDEVASLKGLLLNRHQFPTPTTPLVSHPAARGIPAWQRSTPQQQQVEDTKTESETLVNGEEKVEEEEEEVEEEEEKVEEEEEEVEEKVEEEEEEEEEEEVEEEVEEVVEKEEEKEGEEEGEEEGEKVEEEVEEEEEEEEVEEEVEEVVEKEEEKEGEEEGEEEVEKVEEEVTEAVEEKHKEE